MTEPFVPDPRPRGWPDRLSAWDAPPVTEEQRRIIRAALRSGRRDAAIASIGGAA